ncbi:hypothetical protein E2C01_017080 [Portunus trituberculatus]|uniref:Uncharacterized protein n=1 Tax=Portunus trituberculatus TaxID=210409 RepID=A0A5B7DRC5_PORTR|nr:hypothetical protein [Portunus trituberculatus]
MAACPFPPSPRKARLTFTGRRLQPTTFTGLDLIKFSQTRRFLGNVSSLGVFPDLFLTRTRLSTCVSKA